MRIIPILRFCVRVKSFQRSMSAFPAPSDAPLIDFDANFFHKDLVENVNSIMESAITHGVSHFVVPGSNLADSKSALDLSISQQSVLATAGVHPYHTGTDIYSEESLDILSQLIKRSECLAIGECGLDYSNGFPEKSLQLPWFKSQVKLAVENSLPLYLHVRDAREDFVSVLAGLGFSEGQTPPVDGCVHCFTGDTEELQVYVNMGFYIGLTGYVINQRKDNPGVLKEWLSIIPRERLVIETDAPYMGFKNCRKNEPEKKKSKYPNVPSALPFVACAIAEAGGGSVAEVAEYTTANALRFLRVSKTISS
jgi:TatD DNase family protein